MAGKKTHQSEVAHTDSSITTTAECPFNETEGGVKEKGELDWTSTESQMVLGAYFYGYLVFMIPAGIIADKIGASPMLMLGTFMSSVISLVTPLASRVHWGLIFGLRVLLGFGQAMYYAPLHCIVAAWIPPKERGTWGAVLFSGSHAGSFLNALLTGFLLAALQWDWVFYIWGIVALSWLTIYALTCSYSSPDSCTCLTDKEKAVFEDAEMKYKPHGLAPWPTWLAILSNGPVWAVIFGMWGHDFGLFSLTTELPLFMNQVLHFNIRKNGWMNSLIFLSIWAVGNATGPLTDYIDKKKLISLKLNRIIGTTIASVGPSLGLLLSVYTNCSVTLAMVSLFIGSALMGFFYSSLKLSPIDVAPHFSGTIGAITQTAGAIAGACVPVTVSRVVGEGHLHEWRWFMWITFITMSVTNVLFVLLASAQPQAFNSPEDAQRIKEEKEKKKQEKELKKAEKAAKKGEKTPKKEEKTPKKEEKPAKKEEKANEAPSTAQETDEV